MEIGQSKWSALHIRWTEQVTVFSLEEAFGNEASFSAEPGGTGKKILRSIVN